MRYLKRRGRCAPDSVVVKLSFKQLVCCIATEEGGRRTGQGGMGGPSSERGRRGREWISRETNTPRVGGARTNFSQTSAAISYYGVGDIACGSGLGRSSSVWNGESLNGRDVPVAGCMLAGKQQKKAQEGS